MKKRYIKILAHVLFLAMHTPVCAWFVPGSPLDIISESTCVLASTSAKIFCLGFGVRTADLLMQRYGPRTPLDHAREELQLLKFQAGVAAQKNYIVEQAVSMHQKLHAKRIMEQDSLLKCISLFNEKKRAGLLSPEEEQLEKSILIQKASQQFRYLSDKKDYMRQNSQGIVS